MSSSGGPNKLASLRAMFEKKDDSMSTSPPDRGRSSGAASAASTSSRNGTSPRPLSKVRTSFIAVGGASGLGLRRDSSNDNTARRSAFSMDTDTNPKEMADTKETMVGEMDARRRSAMISETIPENAMESKPSTPLQELDEKVSMNGKPVNGKPATGKASPPIQKSEEAPARKSVDGRTLKPAAVLTSSKSTNGTAAKSPRTTGPSTSKPATIKPAAKPTTTTTKAKPIPAAISTTKKTTTSAKPSPKPPTKSPMPKTPTTPNATVHKKPAAAASKVSKTPEQKAGRASLATNTHKSPHKSPGESPSGFVKPKPKSPTKPVRLPASLTAPTASSRSKTSTTGAPPARSLSRTSAAPTPSLGIRRTQSQMTKKSAIGPPPPKDTSTKARASIDGRPKSAHTNAVAAPSEGFMARMMRPTASSQSKTNEKAPVSPPRKTGVVGNGKKRQSTSRPSTRDSGSVQRGFGGSPSGMKVLKGGSPKVVEKEKEKEKEIEVVKEEEVVELVPETAVEAAEKVIPDIPLDAIKDDKAPGEEKELFGEKTECAPVGDEVHTTVETPEKAVIPEEPKEVEEPKHETPAEISSPTTKEADVKTEVPSTSTENDTEVLKATTAEGNATSPNVEKAGEEGKENAKDEEEEEGESNKVADVGETF